MWTSFHLFKSLPFYDLYLLCIMRQDLDVEGAENEDEDSGGDEHPALRNSLPNSRRYRLFKTFISPLLGWEF